MAAMRTRALALCLLLLAAGAHQVACRQLHQEDEASQEEAPLEGLGPVPAPAPAPGPDGGAFGFEQGEEQTEALPEEEDAPVLEPQEGGEPVQDGDLTIQNGNTLLTTNDVPSAEGAPQWAGAAVGLRAVGCGLWAGQA